MARGTVTGGRETAAALRALSRGPSRNTIRQAHAAALMPIKQSAADHFQRNGSYVNGKIPESMAITHADTSSALHMTGIGKSLGHLIEFGTAPHYQPMRRMEHPGAVPKPYVRPAFDENAQTSVAVAMNLYGAELQALARALRNR